MSEPIESDVTELLRLKEREQTLLLEELDGLLDSLTENEALQPYLDLRQSIQSGQVPEHLIPALENTLLMTLQSGRIRRRHSPQAEQVLQRLFNRTPRGEILRRSSKDTSQALAALQGQALDHISITPKTPGVYRMTIDTDQCQITLEFTPDGVSVTGMGVGI